MAGRKKALREPLLIVFEGIDGAGKTTQARSLNNYLNRRGYATVLLKEPTNGRWGKKIKELSKNGRDKSPRDEMNLFILDRKENIRKNIAPALKKNMIVLLDRYYYSSIAYQGVLKGLSPEKIRKVNEAFAPEPDLVIILDVAPKIGISRITQSRKEATNHFEEEMYLERVRKVFRDYREQRNVQMIDGTPNVSVLEKQIRNMIRSLLSAKRNGEACLKNR